MERLDREEAAASVLTIREIDWEGPGPQINTILRALWTRVDVDERLRPVGAEWAVPEWRTA